MVVNGTGYDWTVEFNNSALFPLVLRSIFFKVFRRSTTVVLPSEDGETIEDWYAISLENEGARVRREPIP